MPQPPKQPQPPGVAAQFASELALTPLSETDAAGIRARGGIPEHYAMIRVPTGIRMGYANAGREPVVSVEIPAILLPVLLFDVPSKGSRILAGADGMPLGLAQVLNHGMTPQATRGLLPCLQLPIKRTALAAEHVKGLATFEAVKAEEQKARGDGLAERLYIEAELTAARVALAEGMQVDPMPPWAEASTPTRAAFQAIADLVLRMVMGQEPMGLDAPAVVPTEGEQPARESEMRCMSRLFEKE
jgi:hypothetical protein